MKLTRWGVGALAAGLGLIWATSATPASTNVQLAGSNATDAGMARFHAQHISWHGCQRGPDDDEGQVLDKAGAQCAEVTVPLDYARPNGRTIKVAISRLKATDTARRIGPIIFNLGGPANPVVGAIVDARQAMGETGARFDLIGLDLRFSGRSTPLDCDWPAGWLPRSAGAGRDSFERMAGLTRDLARRCVQRHADLLPYASTASTARDMDVVRAALGAPKLSYVGYSQGSYLGAAYTQLFPHRADRIVLDSAIDPRRVGTRVLAGNVLQREAALREWAAWAAQRNEQYHLGGTTADVIATVMRTYRTSAQRPLRVGRFEVDDTVLPGLLTGPLSDDTDEANAELATTLQLLARAAAGETVQPSEGLETTLADLLTGAGSALDSPQTAIMCGDAAVSRDPERYWRDIQAHRAEAPLFGPLGRTITPCAFWPAAAAAPVRVHNDVPALIVNAAGDINATLDMGLAMHRALTGSRMIIADELRTHGVYLLRGGPCVDDTVNAYLNSGRLPGRDLRCARA
jgi:pimeloyl-ACP methyl ester carboxylesterase